MRRTTARTAAGVGMAWLAWKAVCAIVRAILDFEYWRTGGRI